MCFFSFVEIRDKKNPRNGNKKGGDQSQSRREGKASNEYAPREGLPYSGA
jgi:hypothetical protein